MSQTAGSTVRSDPAARRRQGRWRDAALVALTAMTAYTTAISWQVQAVSYPLFRAVDAVQFPAYHQQYNETILWPVLIPGFPTAAAGVLFFWIRPARLSGRVAAVVSAASLASLLLTVLWAIPMHDRLDVIGQDGATIDSLLRANLLRSLSFTLSTAALCWGLLHQIDARADRVDR
jgi:hypothetical protein